MKVYKFPERALVWAHSSAHTRVRVTARTDPPAHSRGHTPHKNTTLPNHVPAGSHDKLMDPNTDVTKVVRKTDSDSDVTKVVRENINTLTQAPRRNVPNQKPDGTSE